MPLTPFERKELVRELRQIREEFPGVVVRHELDLAALDIAQDRVDEIDAALVSDPGPDPIPAPVPDPGP